MASKAKNVSFLFGYFPYARIVEGEMDVLNCINYFALIYKNKIVGLGRKSVSPSPARKVYINVIQHDRREVKEKIEELSWGDEAAVSLWVQIKAMGVALRGKLPVPPPRLLYRIYAIRNERKAEYRVMQYPWYNNGYCKYLLGYIYTGSDRFMKICQTNNIEDVEKQLTELTKRKIQLI